MTTKTNLPPLLSKSYADGMFPRVNRWITFLILTCGIFIVLLGYYTPIFDDDAVFSTVLRDTDGNTLPLNQLIDAFINGFTQHYQTANGRLLDKMMPLVMLIPKWLQAIINAIVYIFVTYLFISVSGSSRRPLICVLIIFIFNICFPWAAQMLTTACSVNYMWAGALTLMSLYLFLHPFNLTKKNIGTGTLIFFFCSFAGAAHEAYTLPLLTGFIIYTIINRKQITPSQILTLIAWSVGAISIFTAPGIYTRLNIFPHFNPNTGLYILPNSLRNLVILGIPIFLYLIGIIICLSKKNLRKGLNTNLQIIIIPTVFVSFALDTYLLFESRPMWMTDVFALTGLAGLISSSQWKEPSRKLTVAATGTMTLILFANLSFSLYWQHFVNQAYNNIMCQHRETPGKTIIMDIPMKQPLMCLRKSYIHMLHSDAYLYFDKNTFKPIAIRDISIISPGVEKYLSVPAEYVPLGGNWNCVKFNNFIISRSKIKPQRWRNRFTTLFRDGRKRDVAYSVNQFTGKDGETYYFMNPSLPFNYEFEDIEAIY